MRPVIHIIILNYNNFRCTDFCLESLRRISYPRIKIVLVDNHSRDDSYSRLLEKYPECVGLRSNENGGFSRGTNLGLRHAYALGGEYFLLLNNDVEVTPGFIEPLLSEFEKDSAVGLVTSKIMFREPRDRIWQAGGEINTFQARSFSRGFGETDTGLYDKIEETGWASGACSLISRATIDRIGFLDEFYFFGQEEWDYSKLAAKNGIKIIYTPVSVVYHEIAASTNARPSLSVYQNYRNKLHFARKYQPALYFPLYFTLYLCHALFVFPTKGNLATRNDYYRRAAKRAALFAFYFHLKGVWIDEAHLFRIEDMLRKRYAEC